MIFVYRDRWYSGPTGSEMSAPSGANFKRRQVSPRSEEIREYPEEPWHGDESKPYLMLRKQLLRRKVKCRAGHQPGDSE
jgi:hypothetical protein